MKRLVSILLLTALMIFSLVSCGNEEKIDLKGINFQTEGNERTLEKYNTQNPVAALYVKDYGVIVVELYPDIAPNTVNNFISLIKKGFYDNNSIHRMMPGFVIQGGDPKGNGTGGPGYSIAGEFSKNGVDNDLKHTKGVISMARAEDYDSAGSQFFIMLGNKPDLDGKYAAFGKVIDGYEVCEEIEKIKEYDSYFGKLATNITIVKAVVDTKGKNYPEPEIIK